MREKELYDIRIKLSAILPELNEKQKRYIVAVEAVNFGWGGITSLSKITGMAIGTIRKGIKELKGEIRRSDSIRKSGGGRKKILHNDPDLSKELESIIDEHTRGDPEATLRWTCKSVRNIADALKQKGKAVSYRTIARMLHAMNFSLKANKKTIQGSLNNPDRDKQFKYINSKTKCALKSGLPVISVDAKKKELVGNYKNVGREWSSKGNPKKVNDHDFHDSKVPKVTPFGVYDIGDNKGWINIGISADTAEFAVRSIRGWWRHIGKKRYKLAKSLIICADAGGSNGYRLRLWKKEIQSLCNESGLKITVLHFPPGTSKWNKIEHRLFSFISINWRGRPLLTYQIIIDLISSTKTREGLSVKAVLDKRKYNRGIKITDAEMKLLNIVKHKFHGEWNYTIKPNL